MFAANGEVRFPASHVYNLVQPFDLFHPRPFDKVRDY